TNGALDQQIPANDDTGTVSTDSLVHWDVTIAIDGAPPRSTALSSHRRAARTRWISCRSFLTRRRCSDADHQRSQHRGLEQLHRHEHRGEDLASPRSLEYSVGPEPSAHRGHGVRLDSELLRSAHCPEEVRQALRRLEQLE